MNLSNLSVRTRLLAGFGVLLALLLLSAVLNRVQVGTMREQMHAITEKHFPRSVWANEIVDNVNQIARSMRTMLLADTPALAQEERGKILEARDVIAEHLKRFDAAPDLTAEEKRLVEQVKTRRTVFIQDWTAFVALFDAGDTEGARHQLLDRSRASQLAYLAAINALIEYERGAVHQAGESLETAADRSNLAGMAIGLAALVVGLLMAWGVTRSILRALGGELAIATGAVQRIAAGDLDHPVPVKDADRDSLLFHLRHMQGQLREAAVRAVENTRIRQALDAVVTNVMIADADYNIVYTNPSIDKMLNTAEGDIRKDLPQFSAARVVGSNIDIFHKNPSHQRRILGELRQPHSTRLTIGGRSFSLIVSPIFAADGARLGTVVEWQDLTAQLAAEAAEAARLASDRRNAEENARIRAALDNVTANVMIADNERNIIYMNRSVNDMLLAAEADIRKALPHFDSRKLLNGSVDVFHKNPAHQRDMLANLRSTHRAQIAVGGRTFALIANPVFGADGERLGSVVEWRDRTIEVAVEREVGDIVLAAAGGDFSRRIGLEGKEGFFRQLGESVNQLMVTSEQGLKDIAGVLESVSRGDFTRTIDNDYQGLFGDLKHYCNNTVGSLTRMLQQIREASGTIFTAVNEIAAGNTDLSSRTEQQASSLEETASSMEELTSTVKQNADNARQANMLAVSASSIAEKGGLVVQDVVRTMAAINDSARKIADIISVIDGIAFQTNILALNAAVEAARAGEQGRGFAVVAAEVRNLAQRSAGAAKEIKALITDSVEKVGNGNQLVGQAGTTMQEIVQSIKRVTDLMAEIAAASEEQSSGIEQVNGAVSQMDQMTQQNSALVEQAAAATESLREQAGLLSESVAVFKLSTADEARRAAPPRALPASGGKARQLPQLKRSGVMTSANAAEDEWDEF